MNTRAGTPATATHATPASSAGAAAQAQRKRGIVAIKATQRALGMDDDTYRAMLEAQTGKRSATELSLAEQRRVLEHLRQAYRGHPGAVNPAQERRREARAGGRARGTPAPDRQPLMTAVSTLLQQLDALTGERHSLAYCDAICRRNGWAERIDFCTPQQLHRLVGALARTVRAKGEQRARSAARVVEST